MLSTGFEATIQAFALRPAFAAEASTFYIEEGLVELSEVVLWGRALNEYSEMFSLSEDNLNGKILGCSDGSACFNAQVSRNGGNVISVDPIYQFNTSEIRSRIDEVYPQIMAQMSKNNSDYVWKNIRRKSKGSDSIVIVI